MKGFMPLREDAEKKGKMIKAAGERHAPPDEACKIIGAYGAANFLQSIAAARTDLHQGFHLRLLWRLRWRCW